MINPYDPPSAVSSDVSTAGFMPASKVRRSLNFLIDGAACIIVWFVTLFLFESLWTELSFYDPRVEDPPVFPPPYDKNACGVIATTTTGLLMFLYYLVLEWSLGKTLGKLITRTHVISVQGVRPTLGQCCLRTLVRLVPWDPLTFFLGNGGWHDRMSGTIVARSGKIEDR